MIVRRSSAREQEHHAAPYSITEEFVSVYRLHPLIPDDYEIRDHRTGALIAEDRLRRRSRATARAPSIDEYGWSDLLYSFGIAQPRRDHAAQPPAARSATSTRVNGDRVDLGTIDILRDRERGVPRYNDFREKLRKPRIEKFEDLTDEPGVGRARSATSTTATSTRSTCRSACSPSRCRRASASATRRSGSSS